MTIQEIAPIATAKDLATRLVNGVSTGEAPVSDVGPGMITDVKNLYQSKRDEDGKTSWVDTYPDDLEEAAENAETARYALLLRSRKCYDGRKKLELHSIVVQSPLLKGVLGKVLRKYPGITTTLDRLTFKRPFQLFVHRWKNLVEALESEQDPETKSHVQLLHRVLEAELRDDLKARDDYILNGVITYTTMWMIFEPGITVFSVNNGLNRAAKLTNGNYQQTQCGNSYALSCQIVDWDGEAFGLGGVQFDVGEWEGTKKITKLSAFPLEYHPNLIKLEDELVTRGKAFQDLSGYHYKNYQGIAIGQGPWGPVKYNVSERFIRCSRCEGTESSSSTSVLFDTFMEAHLFRYSQHVYARSLFPCTISTQCPLTYVLFHFHTTSLNITTKCSSFLTYSALLHRLTAALSSTPMRGIASIPIARFHFLR